MLIGMGNKVLVVLGDNQVASLGLVRTLIKHDSGLSRRFVTLMCCCQASYWEHGGGTGTADRAAFAQEITQADARYERHMELADQTFAAATDLLMEAGVPEANITCHICFKGHGLVDAVMHEARQYAYSAVLVNRCHEDVINRLAKRGIWQLFSSRTPQLRVCAVDVEAMQAEIVA